MQPGSGTRRPGTRCPRQVIPDRRPRTWGPARLNKTMMSGLALLGVGGLAGTSPSTAISAGAVTTADRHHGIPRPGAANATLAPCPPTRRRVPEHHRAQRPSPCTGRSRPSGTSSVSIKTSTGTTTYAVSSTSDIEKNGTDGAQRARGRRHRRLQRRHVRRHSRHRHAGRGERPPGMAGGCGPGGTPGAGQAGPPLAPSSSGSSTGSGSSGSSGSSSSPAFQHDSAPA